MGEFGKVLMEMDAYMCSLIADILEKHGVENAGDKALEIVENSKFRRYQQILVALTEKYDDVAEELNIKPEEIKDITTSWLNVWRKGEL